jgi:hypothetical protein
MRHFEVEVDDLDTAVATALDTGDMCTDATHATVNGP